MYLIPPPGASGSLRRGSIERQNYDTMLIPQQRPSSMAMTVRLPDELARRGRRYAAELGVSLNALLAIALREYLDGRAPTPRLAAPSALAQAIARRVQSGPVSKALRSKGRS